MGFQSNIALRWCANITLVAIYALDWLFLVVLTTTCVYTTNCFNNFQTKYYGYLELLDRILPAVTSSSWSKLDWLIIDNGEKKGADIYLIKLQQSIIHCYGVLLHSSAEKPLLSYWDFEPEALSPWLRIQDHVKVAEEWRCHRNCYHNIQDGHIGTSVERRYSTVIKLLNKNVHHEISCLSFSVVLLWVILKKT